MSFTLPFLVGPVFFRTSLTCSGGYHMERGGMPLPTWCGLDKLWKGRNYWKSRLRCQVYGLNGVSWWLCVLSDMTWLPLLCGQRKSWYIIRLEREGDKALIPMEHQYLNLMMLMGSDSRTQSVPCWKGNYGSIVVVLYGQHIGWF